MRPGRLERAIEIKRPDYDGTLNILRYHVAGDVSDGDLGEIAALIRTPPVLRSCSAYVTRVAWHDAERALRWLTCAQPPSPIAICARRTLLAHLHP